jgi:soluble lytic murein transglycosylase
MTEYEGGGGQNTLPTLEDVKARVRAEIGTARPERLKLALSEAENRYNDQVAAIKQKNEAIVATAMREVLANGGKYAELPAGLRAALPPGEVGKVMDFAHKIAKGDDNTNPALYQKLSDPAALRSLTDDQFFALRSNLSEADFKHFSNERAKIIKGAVTNGPGEINSAAIKSTLDDRLRTLGLDPSPKEGTDDSMRVGAIRKFVNDSVAVAQANSGKKMTDAEVAQYIDGLLAKTTTYDKFFGNSSGPMLGMTVGDIPGKAKSALKDAFKKQGIANPTDGQLLDAYWRGISKKQ